MNALATQRLRDALAAAEAATQFMGTTSLDGYKADFGLRLQIERLLEIVGESLSQARRLDPEADLNKHIPELGSIVGMRNRIIHGYDRVDDEMVWSVVSHNVLLLREQIRNLLDQPDDEAGAVPG